MKYGFNNDSPIPLPKDWVLLPKGSRLLGPYKEYWISSGWSTTRGSVTVDDPVFCNIMSEEDGSDTMLAFAVPEGVFEDAFGESHKEPSDEAKARLDEYMKNLWGGVKPGQFRKEERMRPQFSGGIDSDTVSEWVRKHEWGGK